MELPKNEEVKETVDQETGEVKATTEESSATEKQEKTTDELMEELNQSDDAYAREVLESIGVESKFWDKDFKIDEADVVAMYVGDDRNYETKELNKNDDGSVVKLIMIELVNKYGTTQFTTFNENSKLKNELGKALRLYDLNCHSMIELLGKKISIECLNAKAVKTKKEKSYQYEAKILGKADKHVKGVFKLEEKEVKK